MYSNERYVVNVMHCSHALDYLTLHSCTVIHRPITIIVYYYARSEQRTTLPLQHSGTVSAPMAEVTGEVAQAFGNR